MQTQRESAHDCIASNRVEGTAVYGKDGDKMGSVDCVMIEKRSGQAREVIVDVGSFLGMGGTKHTIPWQKLTYDEEYGGYKLDVTEDQLRQAPTHTGEDNERRMSDNDYRASIYSYYAVPIYW